METGQRHQTVSQGDTTTPGFVPIPVDSTRSSLAPCRSHARQLWICSASDACESGCARADGQCPDQLRPMVRSEGFQLGLDKDWMLWTSRSLRIVACGGAAHDHLHSGQCAVVDSYRQPAGRTSNTRGKLSRERLGPLVTAFLELDGRTTSIGSACRPKAVCEMSISIFLAILVTSGGIHAVLWRQRTQPVPPSAPHELPRRSANGQA